MKIGILTHHYVKNYGAFLQMKAMYETLKRLYPEAQILIVNYINKKHWRKNMIHVLHYRRKIDTPAIYMKKIKQLSVFSKYEKSLPRTKKVKSAEDIKKLRLNLLVLGSDEIWNLLGSGYHPLKFGTGLESQKTIAYAPSVGAVTDETELPEEIIPGLKGIGKLSGRDEETVRFVKRTVGRNAVKMLDPTFLYNFDVDIEKENVQPKQYRYILIYDCKLTDSMINKLREYADEKGYKIIGAGDYKKFYDEVGINLTPYEWVSLFSNAEQVVTGTFHGTVFSIKYEKPLLCYPTEKNRINKISSLLNDMGLQDRLLKVGSEDEFTEMLSQKTNYSFAREYIEQKKQEADKYLLGE